MANVVDTVAIKMVVDASGVVEGIGATTKEINEATRIVNSMRTPLERLEEKERRLQELFAKGAIEDIPRYERALQSIENQKKELAAASDKEASSEEKTLALKKQFVDANARMIASDRQVINTQKEVIQQFSILGDLIRFHLITRGISMVTQGFREMVGGVREAQNRLDEIGDIATRLGYSSTDLQRLRIEANLTDVSFNALTNGIEKLMIRTADAAAGNRELVRIFQLLGINIAALSQNAEPQQFYMVADAISQIEDRGLRLSIISDLFGRGNTEMIAFIDNLAEVRGQADATKAIMSEYDIKRIGDADTAIKVLSHSLEGVFNVAAAQLSPVVKEIADELSIFLSREVNGEGLRLTLIMVREHIYAIFQTAKDTVSFVKLLIDAMSQLPMAPGQDDPYIQQRVQAARSARQTEIESEGVRRRNMERFGIPDIQHIPQNWEGIEQLRQLELKRQAEKRRQGDLQQELALAQHAEQAFDDERRRLTERNILLREGASAAQEYRDQQAGLDAEQQDYLAGLREEVSALEARKFAEEQDKKLRQERINDAERIRQENMTPEQQAVARIQQAQDLVTTNQLSQEQFDMFLERQAAALVSAQPEFKLSATAFGSQQAIAATLGKNMESDSERLESMKQSLLTLANTPPIEVSEIGAF